MTTTRRGAVITAGGRSARLGPVGQVIPKGLLPLTGPPDGGPPETAIGRLVTALQASGVTDTVIAANDHPWFDKAAAALGVGKIVVPPTGEYDAVRLGYEALPRCGTVAVVSSDNVFPDRGLERFLAAPAPELPVVATAPVTDVRRYTEVATTSDGALPLPRVVRLNEKPDRDGGGLAKSGAYRFPSAVLDDLRRGAVPQDRFGERSMTEALLRVMTAGPLLAFDLPASFLDIGTPEGLDAAIQPARPTALSSEKCLDGMTQARS